MIPAVFVEQAIQVEMHEMTSFEDARKRFERDYLTRLMKLTQGSVSQAARLARRNRTEFYKLLQRHGIEAAMFKPEPQMSRAVSGWRHAAPRKTTSYATRHPVSSERRPPPAMRAPGGTTT